MNEQEEIDRLWAMIHRYDELCDRQNQLLADAKDIIDDLHGVIDELKNRPGAGKVVRVK